MGGFYGFPYQNWLQQASPEDIARMQLAQKQADMLSAYYAQMAQNKTPQPKNDVIEGEFTVIEKTPALLRPPDN